MYRTLNTDARRVARPPQKSPAPQTSADANPNTTEASSLPIVGVFIPLVRRVEDAQYAAECRGRNNLRIFSTMRDCANPFHENSRDSWARRSRIGIHHNRLRRS